MHILLKEDNPAESPPCSQKSMWNAEDAQNSTSRETQTGNVFLMGDGLFALYTGHQIEVG